MSQFLRLLDESDKATALLDCCAAIRAGHPNPRSFDVAPESFATVPGKPFAYWVTEGVRNSFKILDPLNSPDASVVVCATNSIDDDFRFVRLWWEAWKSSHSKCDWITWAKGGAFSPIYYDIDTVIHWNSERETYHGFTGTTNRPLSRPAALQHFLRPGLTWPRRTQGGLSFRVMPAGSIFANKGPAVFAEGDSTEILLALAGR